jgi:hypothetical protein
MNASLEHLKDLMDKQEPDNDGYFDEVGGFHNEAIGWNFHGIWHGERICALCKDCPYENDTTDRFKEDK